MCCVIQKPLDWSHRKLILETLSMRIGFTCARGRSLPPPARSPIILEIMKLHIITFLDDNEMWIAISVDSLTNDITIKVIVALEIPNFNIESTQGTGSNYSLNHE